jgi:hypothetical protein
MSIQSDRWRSELAAQCRMIEPFRETPATDGLLADRSLDCGREFCAFNKFKILSRVNSMSSTAKAFHDRALVPAPPRPFTVPRSIEFFCIPSDVLSICVGESTGARCGSTRQRDAIQAGADEIRDTGFFQRDTAIGQGPCQRRAVPSSVFHFPRNSARSAMRPQGKASEATGTLCCQDFRVLLSDRGRRIEDLLNRRGKR